MNSFTAIDFETAHGARNSICQVGLVRIEEGLVVHQCSILVQPPGNFYWNWFTAIHGISSQITLNEPSFDSIWPQIEPFIKNQNVVAHNGFGFDFPVLNKTLEYYGISTPAYQKHCTYRIYKTNLASLCHRYQIPLNHHDALSDAMACAELFKMHLKKE
jgi:DNA polymerase-3 subunit epsilon